jgi:hypothetical protein
MRKMEIPPFRSKVEISDVSALEYLYKTRLSQKADIRATQAIPLLGYMGWPNDTLARENAMQTLKGWLEGQENSHVPDNMILIHRHWAGVADIVQLRFAMSHGRHQECRGGVSTGKAVSLAAEEIESRGASESSLWQNWSNYKDAAHLIAAAMLVCADMKERNRRAPFGITLQDLLPVRVVCLVPEIVIGIALSYQDYGLSSASNTGQMVDDGCGSGVKAIINDDPDNSGHPMLDAETVWRIPENINVEPIEPWVQKITKGQLVILDGRRAGNRGRANRHETTPVSD